ncbi:MAG: putative MFS-type transporter [Burkholderiaceae bacterium]|jgi:D-galactonate transporter|nr:MAG: putative MFS-type transporter [Burkholderiaceae bacterium]
MPTAILATPAPTAHDALYAKITRRVLPFLFICYVVNFIDRVNIGYAKLQFLQDLHLNDEIYGIAAGMFFIGYLVFEVPSNLLLARIGARKTLTRIMVLWGLITVALMFVKTAGVLYVLRFLLGAAEAGFFPGIIFYLTFWFPNHRRGRCTSLFILAVPIAGIIGGPLSGWIMSSFHEFGGLRGWQWLFLLEGIPAVVLGVLALFVLTDRPENAHWLTDAEKSAVAADLERDRQQDHRSAEPARLVEALRDPYLYLFSAVYFTMFLYLNALGFWVPTILKSVGVSSLEHIGLLHGAISVATAIGMVLIGRSSDRRLERRWHAAISGAVAAVCFLLLPLAAHSAAVTTLLLAIGSVGIFGVLITFWTIPASYFKGTAAAGGIAVISSLGAIGGAVSPSLVGTMKVHTGSIYGGLSIVAVLLALGMLALLVFVPRSFGRKPA